MKFYEARRTIGASASRVWATLTDAQVLVSAGTGITRLEGRIGPREKIKLWTDVSPRAFALQVVAFEPEQRMVWKGAMPLGLFTGIRQFNLRSDGNTTEFHMREDFSGLLLPLIWKSMPDLQPSFEKFADALKQAAEESR